MEILPSEATKKMPKILYLCFNLEYMNPTRNLLLRALEQKCDMEKYGPGFSSSATLERGIENFVAENGPYDFILADEYVLQSFDLENEDSYSFQSHACEFDPRLLIHAAYWQEFFKSYSGRRVICLLQSDYYNFPEVYGERLRHLGDFFITWGREFIADTATETDNHISFTDQDIQKKANTVYANFLDDCEDKIICCPHFVGNDEFDATPLHKRPAKWSVLGADYSQRLIARQILDNAKVSRSGKWLRYYFSLAQKLRINVYNKYTTLWIMQKGFRKALSNSKYSFTCGSSLRWPIRKFFEIPAGGCVLVAHKPHGYGALGFNESVNSLIIDAENIQDIHAWLETNPEEAQEIADAGRALILEKHNVDARAHQISCAFDAILNDEFYGSRWHRGEFKIKTSDNSCLT